MRTGRVELTAEILEAWAPMSPYLAAIGLVCADLVYDYRIGILSVRIVQEAR